MMPERRCDSLERDADLDKIVEVDFTYLRLWVEMHSFIYKFAV